jgi:hypothetical protein
MVIRVSKKESIRRAKLHAATPFVKFASFADKDISCLCLKTANYPNETNFFYCFIWHQNDKIKEYRFFIAMKRINHCSENFLSLQ